MFRALLLGLIFIEHAYCTCGPPALTLPITNVALSNDHFRRGVPLQIGTPAQNISLAIHTYLNDTWIYNATNPLCDDMNITESQCVTTRGGVYDTEDSTSYTHREDVFDAGGDPSDVARALGTHIWDNTWATDDIVVDNTTLSEFPVGMPGFDFGGSNSRYGALGLGQNTTFLSWLKDQNSIASRSWSFWWGIDNSASRSAMDGQIIFGGYDAAKVVGEPFTQPLQNASANCQSGMYLTITNILLNFPNGTTSDLNPSSALTACLQPDFPAVMTIPAEPFYWKFENITETHFISKSRGTYWWNPIFPPQNVYAGDLEIRVQGGPSISIPNDVLVVPDQYIDEAGAVRGNTSAATLLLSPNDGPNVNDIPLIGMAFFSGAYLSVNLDNRTWSIWPAKATTDTKITTIGATCEETTNITTSSTPSNPDGEQRNIRPDPEDDRTLSTGAIAGIAVGGAIGAVAVIGLITFLIIKKRKAKRKASAIETFSRRRPGELPAYDQQWYDDRHPMMNSHVPLQEMLGSQTVPYELKTEEKPVEMGRRSGWYGRRTQVRESPVELPAARF